MSSNTKTHTLVVTDAARQLLSRVISALFGFAVTKIMASYLGVLRYGDYNSILKYFAFWTALADLWLYVLAVRRLGELKEIHKDNPNHPAIAEEYWKFVATRIVTMVAVYGIAILIAYMIPWYRENPYYVRWLPLWLLFSASFMFAGIQQLPLQVFWQMKKLSISLITARLSQLTILLPVVYYFFKGIDFSQDPTALSITAFCLVLFSVVGSWIGQNLEIHHRSKKILPLKIIFDRSFIKTTIKSNRNYWLSYYLSSFHTLLPLLFLTWFYPTISGKDYSWLRWLSLWLIEILLIIPSALGNSLLHSVTKYSQEAKLKSLWNLMHMMIWFWTWFAVNFWLFSKMVILITADKTFLWSRDSIHNRWSDQLMPFLWIILACSFIKQVYNYIFVATEKQNVLLIINGFGVFVGIGLWLWLIPDWNIALWLGLFWAMITQLVMEILFMCWAIATGIRHRVSPIMNSNILMQIILIMWSFATIWRIITRLWIINMNYIQFFLIAGILNLVVIGISYKLLKRISRGLAVQEPVEQLDTNEIVEIK
jgi:O-antigen/teichoic acid export membrane protein